jgi:hypothetical protein
VLSEFNSLGVLKATEAHTATIKEEEKFTDWPFTVSKNLQLTQEIKTNRSTVKQECYKQTKNSIDV